MPRCRLRQKPNRLIPLDLLHFKTLELIALSDIVKALNADAALISGCYLAHIVFEATQRINIAFVNNDTVAYYADLTISDDFAA